MNAFNNGPGYDPKNLQIIFIALLFTQLVLFVSGMMMLNDAEFSYQLNNISFTAIPLAALVLDIIGNKVFKTGFQKLSQEKEIEESLNKLTRIHIIRWILVEAATFILLIFTVVHNNHFFSAFAAVNIVYFYTLRPKLFTFNEGFNP